MNFNYNNFYQSQTTRYKTLKPSNYEDNDNKYEKAGAVPSDVKPLQNELDNYAPQYTKGFEPYRGENISGMKPLQQSVITNYSTPEETYISKEEAVAIFSSEELDKYFEYKFVTKSRENGDRQDMWLAYVIKSGLEIDGKSITTVQDLIKAIKEKNSSSSTREKTLKPSDYEDNDNKYEKAETVPAGLKSLQNELERQPLYDMGGIEPRNGKVPSNAKPLKKQEINNNYSTPTDTYLSRDEADELFSDEELTKYFDYSYVIRTRGDRQDMWLAYVIKSGLEIDGKQIKTVNELLKAIGKTI